MIQNSETAWRKSRENISRYKLTGKNFVDKKTLDAQEKQITIDNFAQPK